MIQVFADESAQKFLDFAGPLLYRDEPTNSLMLGLCATLLNAKELMNPSPLLLRVMESSRLKTAAIQWPAHNLVLTFAEDEDIDSLVQYLHKNGIQFPGVIGPDSVAEVFSKKWSILCDQSYRLGMGQKLYKLETVTYPKGVSGHLHQTTSAETAIVADMLHCFASEAIPHEKKNLDHYLDTAKVKISQGYSYLWMHEGTPVSAAHVGRPTKNGISVSGVYTPPEFRKMGYASALVAHLSQKMLDSGYKFCVLYTDLANPTSNKIYQNVGYRAVSDSKHFLIGKKDTEFLERSGAES